MAEHGIPGGAPLPAALDAELICRLLEVAPDALVLVEASGRITYGNRAVAQLYGAPLSALVGQPVEVLVPDAAPSGGHACSAAGPRPLTVQPLACAAPAPVM